jgi:hypothetical protein
MEKLPLFILYVEVDWWIGGGEQVAAVAGYQVHE